MKNFRDESLKMVDLRGQYHQIKEEIHQAIGEVLETSSFINGPFVQKFSQQLGKYLSNSHVVSCGNGTDALWAAIQSLELPKGSEIMVPDFTFCAPAEMVLLAGYRPVLVDVDPKTFLIDAEKVAEAFSSETRAIIPVHLFGQCAPMVSLLELAKENNCYVIEDACQALGARYSFGEEKEYMAGTMGDIGCTSFFPSKNLGAYGDGGALWGKESHLLERARVFLNHGSQRKYFHQGIGINSRLDGLQAAVLSVKLKYLDLYNQKREKAARLYDNILGASPLLEIPYRVAESTHIFHQYTLKLAPEVCRDALKDYLAQKGIPSMIYYPLPLHQQKAYKDCRVIGGDVSKDLSSSVLSLPMHTELSPEMIIWIGQTVLEFLEKG